jgi:hypothetical protein
MGGATFGVELQNVVEDLASAFAVVVEQPDEEPPCGVACRRD